MKRSASELMLEAPIFASDDGGDEWSPPPSLEELFVLPVALGGGFEFTDRDEVGSFFVAEDTWQLLDNPTPNISTISAVESPSICAGTPTSYHKPVVKINQAFGGISGSDQSDDESLELDGGPCEQSTNAIDPKHLRRMESNRESARRSRKRKQAQLEGLELQVDQLRGDKSSLVKQLTNVENEFGEALADNYILKANVEALRIKVKMAEDMVLVSRGTLACRKLDHLLRSNAGSPQFLSPQQTCQTSPDFLPAINFQDDDSCFIEVPSAEQLRRIGVENNDAKNAEVSSEHCKHREPPQ